MFAAIVTSLFGYCAIALQQLEVNVIKHTAERPSLEVVSGDGTGGGGGAWILLCGGDGRGAVVERVNRGLVCFRLPGVCSHPKAQSSRRRSYPEQPRRPLDDNKTSRANATMTPSFC